MVTNPALYHASTIAPLFLIKDNSLFVAETKSVLSACGSKELRAFDALSIIKPEVISEAAEDSLGIKILNLYALS